MFCRISLVVTVIITLYSLACSQIIISRKNKEIPPPPLVYPFGSTLKLLFGLTMPIEMPGRILVYGQNIQFQFPLPQNATFFTNYFNSTSSQSRRRKRTDDELSERSMFYHILKEEWRRRGAPGKDCLKKSICEYAESPFGDDGLMGEIFHVLFTPDYGGSLDVDRDYKEAAEIGRMSGDCSRHYSSCPFGFGFLDHITQVFDL